MSTYLSVFLSICVVLAVLVYSGFIWQRFSHARQIGITLVARAVPFEQKIDYPTMRILVAGDSTGVGTGSANPKESIAGRLGQKYPTAQVQNISQNGLKLAGLLEKLNALEQDDFDLIILQIGANDVIAFTSTAKVRAQLTEILTLCDKLSNQTMVLTAGDIGAAPVFLWPLSSLFTWRTLQVREIFRQAIALHPDHKYIDLFKDVVNEPFSKNVVLYYAADHFHPSGDGYGLWFEQLETVLPADSRQ